MADADFRYKVILLGNIDVGKTSIIIRFTENTFTEAYQGEIDQKSRDLTVDGKTARIIITDTAGQERFRTLTSSYYRNADAIIIVYDVANQESFDDVDGHIVEGCRYSQRSEKFLVGNKIDLEDQRVITTEQGKELADKHSIYFTETSAKSGEGLEELFNVVAKRLMGQAQLNPETTGTIDLIQGKKQTKGKKGGCEV